LKCVSGVQKEKNIRVASLFFGKKGCLRDLARREKRRVGRLLYFLLAVPSYRSLARGDRHAFFKLGFETERRHHTPHVIRFRRARKEKSSSVGSKTLIREDKSHLLSFLRHTKAFEIR
jgi:hypothetical protein